jgi:hypothetical protein
LTDTIHNTVYIYEDKESPPEEIETKNKTYLALKTNLNLDMNTRYITSHIKLILLCLTLGFVSCENKDLFICEPAEGNAFLQVIIDWEDKPQTELPDYMRIFWYPQQYSNIPLVSDMPRKGGFDRLPADKYTTLCLDYSNSGLEFRGTDTRDKFEIYNTPARGLYNEYVPQLPGETTVAESKSNTFYFYADSRNQIVDTENIPLGDTVKVYFYPQNVLREFTFMIYGVQGAKNMSRAPGGAISGMSGSYFPANGTLVEKPSTILRPSSRAAITATNDIKDFIVSALGVGSAHSRQVKKTKY